MANLDNIIDYLAESCNGLVSENKTGAASSIAANARANLTVNVAKSGYTPLGIVAASLSGSSSALGVLNSYTLSGTTATVTVKNDSSAAHSWAAVVRVLYIKNAS